MVRKLYDLCILAIELNLKHIPKLRINLPGYLRELLLHRLALHNHLSPPHKPYVTYNLFSDSLKHINFSYCTQITDDLFCLLNDCGCKLTSFCLNTSLGFSVEGLANFLLAQDELEILKLKRLHTLSLLDSFEGKIRSTRLSELSFTYCDFMTDKILCSIGLYSKGITKLRLERMKLITDEGVVGLLKQQTEGKLIIFKVYRMFELSGKTLDSFSEFSPKLEQLIIPNCTKVSLLSIYTVLSKCGNLKVLDIPITTNLTGETFGEIISQKWNSLQQLNISGNTIVPETMALLSVAFPNLKKFYFGGTEINNSIFEQLLMNFNGLTTFDCMYCRNADQKTSELISEYCHSLETLAIGAWKLDGEGLLPLFEENRALKLTSIELTGCKNTSPRVLNSLIGNCKNLEVLFLRGINAVDDQTVYDIANNLKQLKKISFRGCTHILLEESLVELILECRMLQMIGFPGLLCVRDRLIYVIADNLFDLEVLYIDGCNYVSSHALDYLRRKTTSTLYIEHKLVGAIHI
ncbi:F-box/LRR-repeat protein 2-like isoform X1 [Oopsacas minuta]|uniref:F-box/LRR-repeat protein 2-like isoform X1 n=1 Tax=Oopsacas minuta TaxID=111878 RepID=A0AAV7KJ69_9METZ|nr:F-box/LRR-repeat protein 2-like isoform X1 [Oopsacas minuta]